MGGFYRVLVKGPLSCVAKALCSAPINIYVRDVFGSLHNKDHTTLGSVLGPLSMETSMLFRGVGPRRRYWGSFVSLWEYQTRFGSIGDQ